MLILNTILENSTPACSSSTVELSEEAHQATSEVTVHFKVQCSNCAGDITLVKLHVAAYLTKHIQPAQSRQTAQKKDSRKVKPKIYGEVLTRDEMVAQLEEEAKEKQEKLRNRAEPRKNS